MQILFDKHDKHQWLFTIYYSNQNELKTALKKIPTYSDFGTGYMMHSKTKIKSILVPLRNKAAAEHLAKELRNE